MLSIIIMKRIRHGTVFSQYDLLNTRWKTHDENATPLFEEKVSILRTHSSRIMLRNLSGVIESYRLIYSLCFCLLWQCGHVHRRFYFPFLCVCALVLSDQTKISFFTFWSNFLLSPIFFSACELFFHSEYLANMTGRAMVKIEEQAVHRK